MKMFDATKQTNTKKALVINKSNHQACTLFQRNIDKLTSANEMYEDMYANIKNMAPHHEQTLPMEAIQENLKHLLVAEGSDEEGQTPLAYSIRNTNEEESVANSFSKTLYSFGDKERFDNAFHIKGANQINNLSSYSTATVYTIGIQMYHNTPGLSAVIDRPIDDALKNKFIITCEDTNVVDFINERFKQIDFHSELRKAILYAVLSTRGSVMYYHHDAEGKLAFCNAVPDTNFIYYGIDSDPASRGFQKPKHIKLISDLSKNQEDEHLHHINYNWNPVLQLNQDYLKMVNDTLIVINVQVNATGIALLQSNHKILKIPAVIEDNETFLGRNNELNVLKQRVADNLENGDVITLLEGADIEFNTPNFQGLEESNDTIITFLSMITQIPQSHLTGHQEGEIASGEKIYRQYNELVRGKYQEKMIRPVVEQAIKLIKKEIGYTKEVIVEFPPAYEQNQEEIIDEKMSKLKLITEILSNPDLRTKGVEDFLIKEDIIPEGLILDPEKVREQGSNNKKKEPFKIKGSVDVHGDMDNDSVDNNTKVDKRTIIAKKESNLTTSKEKDTATMFKKASDMDIEKVEDAINEIKSAFNNIEINNLINRLVKDSQNKDNGNNQHFNNK